MCVCNPSTPKVIWEEETGEYSQKLESQPKVVILWGLKQSPFVFQSFSSESVTLWSEMSLCQEQTMRHCFHPTARYLHPEGLPADYTMTFLFRILPDTPQEPFALWEILNKKSEPLVGLILDSKYIYVCSNCCIHDNARGPSS